MAAKIVTAKEWQAARADLLQQEKEATRLLDNIAAKRQGMPLLEIEEPGSFKFLDLKGDAVSLLDLFEGRRQLIIYHHMPFNPDGQGCGGCSFFSDHIPHDQTLQHLQSRDTTFAATAPESPARVESFKQRMGWSFPFYSSQGTWSDVRVNGERFTWEPDEGAFRLNCFFKDADKVYLTWTTTSRGVEPVLSTYALLDMTKLGRQEDSGARFKYHDQY